MATDGRRLLFSQAGIPSRPKNDENGKEARKNYFATSPS